MIQKKLHPTKKLGAPRKTKKGKIGLSAALLRYLCRSDGWAYQMKRARAPQLGVAGRTGGDFFLPTGACATALLAVRRGTGVGTAAGRLWRITVRLSFSLWSTRL